jgi:hypothetical protein
LDLRDHLGVQLAVALDTWTLFQSEVPDVEQQYRLLRPIGQPVLVGLGNKAMTSRTLYVRVFDQTVDYSNSVAEAEYWLDDNGRVQFQTWNL